MRILLIQNTISSYRIPIYNRIAEDYDLAVMCSYGDIPKDINFKVIKIECANRWKFIVHKADIRCIAEEYDVVIGMLSPNWLSISGLAYGKRTYKFIPWGIGVPASYSVRYDDPKKQVNVKLTISIIKKSDAVIFYSDYPAKKYISMGIAAEKMFVAHNTVEVVPIEFKANKDCILFVGSLYKAKSLLKTLELYKKAYEFENDIPEFLIIGSGDEFDDLKKWVSDNDLTKKIRLLGAIYDEKILSEYFSRALFCVSLGQAGLTVQKSFGYGVPFITSKDAYTGGERLDIADGINGILLENNESFTDIILDAANNKDKYVNMGKSARDYYEKNCTIEKMYDGVKNAIEYAMRYSGV